MLRYTLSTDVCRSRIIEEYFGESNARDCGICDICIARRKRERANIDVQSIDNKIVALLAERDMEFKDVVAAIGGDAAVIASRIDYLVGEGKISLSLGGKLKINK